MAQVRWDQRIGTRARLDSTFRWLTSERAENYHEPRGITGGTVMQREFRDQFRTNDDWSWNANLNTPVRLGATRHDLSSGVEVVSQDFLFRSATARQQNAGGPVPPLALASPQYGVVNPAAYGLTPDRFVTDTARTRRVGLYAQDLIGLGARVNVLVGGRVDTYDDSGFSAGATSRRTRPRPLGASAWSSPQPDLSLYGTVANGFTRAPV